MVGNIHSSEFNIPGLVLYDDEPGYDSAKKAKEIDVKLGHGALISKNAKF